MKLPFVLCLVLATGLIVSSCGESGSEPSEEVAKDKFIGDYEGEVSCPGVLASVISDPSLTFNISNAIPEADNRVQVNLPSLPIPLELTGTVSGNDVEMDETTVEDVTVPFGGLEIMADITASGNGSINGNNLTATIDLVGKSTGGETLATDKCTITATKQ